jgi:hypothetical protein
VIDELAGGGVRAVGAVLRFLLEILRDALVELVQRLFARIFAGFFEIVAYLLKMTVRALDALYRLIFRPAGLPEDRSMLLHAAAICTLMAIGFCFGAVASTIYHADWSVPNAVTATVVER